MTLLRQRLEELQRQKLFTQHHSRLPVPFEMLPPTSANRPTNWGVEQVRPFQLHMLD